MANWAYIENGVVVEAYSSLPNNWRNISNFFALEEDPETLRDLGWYPVEVITPALLKNQEYGETKYTLNRSANKVIENTQVIDKPVEEIDVLKQNFLNSLRYMRNELLTASDWTQALDLQNIKSESWKKSWAKYRQDLRDLPAYYEQNYDISMSEMDIAFPPKPTIA